MFPPILSEGNSLRAPVDDNIVHGWGLELQRRKQDNAIAEILIAIEKRIARLNTVSEKRDGNAGERRSPAVWKRSACGTIGTDKIPRSIRIVAHGDLELNARSGRQCNGARFWTLPDDGVQLRGAARIKSIRIKRANRRIIILYVRTEGGKDSGPQLHRHGCLDILRRRSDKIPPL